MIPAGKLHEDSALTLCSYLFTSPDIAVPSLASHTLTAKGVACETIVCSLAQTLLPRSAPLSLGRLQSLDWTSGLDWWTGLVDWTGGLTLKTIFTLSNETHSPVGLHDA